MAFLGLVGQSQTLITRCGADEAERHGLARGARVCYPARYPGGMARRVALAGHCARPDHHATSLCGPGPDLARHHGPAHPQLNDAMGLTSVLVSHDLTATFPLLTNGDHFWGRGTIAQGTLTGDGQPGPAGAPVRECALPVGPVPFHNSPAPPWRRDFVRCRRPPASWYRPATVEGGRGGACWPTSPSGALVPCACCCWRLRPCADLRWCATRCTFCNWSAGHHHRAGPVRALRWRLR